VLVWRTPSFLPANEQVAILQSAVRMKIYSNILEMIGGSLCPPEIGDNYYCVK